MPQDTAARAHSVGVECIIPILNVASLPASLGFYTGVLGFRLDWQPGPMASVSRDGRDIMLCQQDQGHPGTSVWIGVEDIEPLFAAWAHQGVKVRQPPTNHPWAYEMQIEDPDGHVLRFGSEPKRDEPTR